MVVEYASIFVVDTKDVVNCFNVDLAAIAALEVNMLVCPQPVQQFWYVCS